MKETVVQSKKETVLNKRGDVKAPSAKKKKEKEKIISTDKIIVKGKRSRFPAYVSPMLATMLDKPFDIEGWQYEI